MNYFDLFVTVIEVGTQITGAAAAIAAVVPKASGAVPVLQGLRSVLDVLACNFGHARNEK